MISHIWGGWTIGPRGIKQTFHCILLYILDPCKYITCSKTILRKTNLPKIELNIILIPGLSFLLKGPFLNKRNSPSSLVRTSDFIHLRQQELRAPQGMKTCIPAYTTGGAWELLHSWRLTLVWTEPHSGTMAQARHHFCSRVNCLTVKHPLFFFLPYHSPNLYVQTQAKDTISLGVKSAPPLRVRDHSRDYAKLNLKSTNRPSQ